MLRNLILALLLFVPGLALAGPNTLAVLYFQNSGGPTYDALKVGMAQMLINDLVGIEGVTVVERTALQAILDELELGHSGMVDPDTAARVGKLLGAEWMAMGTYFELGGTLYVQSRMVRVETGEILHAFSVNDQATAFLELERELATSYRDALRTLVSTDGARRNPTRRGTEDQGASAAPTSETPGAEIVIAAPDPKALEAAIAFSEGLIYLDTKDLPRAREAFEQAVAADPRLDDAKEQLAALEI
ncbi:MAG: hypothetical protein JRI25_08865 [Deltaproteobacteria bacterium]|nr:hypothetical protein [Deltaproteobacteria bacterium]MBW2254692.1 hypothetical protein [Deltaproteobacteria bacterium]